jgi:Rrf2 family protein
MRLTNATSYAIYALVHLAGQKDNRPVASHWIARQRGLPERFLLKVLKSLAARGILRSVKGPNGGYRLAKTPKEITLLEIVENVDGPIQSQGGFEGSSGSNLGKKLQAVWDRADEEIRRQLGKVRLSDLAAKG